MSNLLDTLDFANVPASERSRLDISLLRVENVAHVLENPARSRRSSLASIIRVTRETLIAFRPAAASVESDLSVLHCHLSCDFPTQSWSVRTFVP